jgi:murein peptide amidase A
MTVSRRVALLAGASMALAGCGHGGRGAGAPATTTTTTTPGSTATTTTVEVTTSEPSTTVEITTSEPTTTSTAPLTPAGVEIGRSVEGRPIVAIERGEPGGQAVLVIGCIHGDEAAGLAVAEQLATAPIPSGIDVWLVPTMNPDGQAHDTRTNANQVDLNRNFPFRWAPLEQSGGSEYAGPSAASEPETKAIVALISRVQPALTIWYHQDLNRIAPATGRAGRIRQRYAELTALPVLAVTGGTYTGTASPWAQNKVSGVSFIVELGPSLTDQQVVTHAGAVLTVASELGSI